MPPRLAVVISLDQGRADFLERFRPYFGAGGFNRLLEGAVYEKCQYEHASTTTANGHATLMTGVHADVHGIIGNEWLLADTLEKVTAVSDRESPLVGTALAGRLSAEDEAGAKAGASPRRLLAPTVGDQLKLRYGAACRVISLSSKDRSAIMMGGRLADAAYWLDGGSYVTSRYYREALPGWADEFNREGRVEKDFGREWTRLIDPKAYEQVQGADNAPGEENADGLGTTFPHRVDGGRKEISGKFYEAHRISPFNSELTVAFAKAAIRGEQLGRHAAPDLLCVGFSQTDACGHAYGPDSHEIMDTMLRIDRLLADFLTFLDSEVGAGKYVVVLAADHGAAPLPERVNGEMGASRFDGGAVRKAVEAALEERFGAAGGKRAWTVRDGGSFRLRAETLTERGIARESAADVVKAVLSGQPQIAAAFTRTELLAAPAQGSSIIAAVRRSYHAQRGADVVFVLKPYVVDRSIGSNHGTPYDYDNHVPLVWYGAGIVPGRHVERVSGIQIAPTLTGLLGVPRPPQSVGERLF